MIMLKDALARLRRERGLTQEELARRLYITRQAVSRWEVGATESSIDMLKLIARELERSPQMSSSRALPRWRCASRCAG